MKFPLVCLTIALIAETCRAGPLAGKKVTNTLCCCQRIALICDDDKLFLSVFLSCLLQICLDQVVETNKVKLFSLQAWPKSPLH